MKILSAEPDPTLLMSNTGEDRPEGVHLSDILVRLAWERDKKYHPDAPKDYQMFEQGHTWETILEGALARRHGGRVGYRPDPIQEDGIWLSPDWIGEDAHGRAQAEEWKSTKKSSKNLPDKIEEWLPQGKAYLRALLRRKLVAQPVMCWRVWCIMGDWSFEAKGDLALFRDYYTVRVAFDQRELDEEWQRIVSAGFRYGLLNEEKPWDERPSLNRTVARRLAGSPRPRSRKPAPVVTFPSGKTTPRRSGSG